MEKDVKDDKKRKQTIKRFAPVTKDSYVREKLYVFDIETYKKEATPKQFWFGCIYGWNYRCTFRNIEEFKQILRSPRFTAATIFAHNAGAFDLLLMFGQIAKDNNVKWKGSKFISMKWHNKITFGDSLNILLTGAAEIGKALGMEKLELENIGKIKRGTVVTEKHIEYCIRDCEIIWFALDEIFKETGKICLTAASVCMRQFRRNFLNRTIITDIHKDAYFLNAYCGGRTEAFELGRTRKKIADVKSMYPTVMLYGRYPDPTRLKECTRPSRKKMDHLLAQYEGCGNFVIQTSSGNIPILPIKEDNMLLFKNGLISGWWCFNEVREAVKYGAKIISCQKMVYSIPFYGEELFGPYIRHYYNIKETGEGFVVAIAKLMLNGLYGKLCEHKSEERLYFDTKELARKYMQAINDFDWTLHTFSQKRKDCLLVKELSTIDKNTTLFCLGAYVTANARLHLYQLFRKVGIRNVGYCDTDSIFLPWDFNLKEGKELGQLELVRNKDKESKYYNRLKMVTAIYGPKDYRTKWDGETGKIHENIKGIPKHATKIGKQKYRYDKLIRAREALRRDKVPGKNIWVEKSLRRIYKKRRIFAKGKTKPFIST